MSAFLNLVTVVGVMYFFPAQQAAPPLDLAISTDLTEAADFFVAGDTNVEEVSVEPVVEEVITNTPTETVQVQNQASTQPAPQKQSAAKVSGCLIKIYDGIYDLDKFRSIHDGGDIFQCNTDMTSIFESQHPKSYLSSIAKYRVK